MLIAKKSFSTVLMRFVVVATPSREFVSSAATALEPPGNIAGSVANKLARTVIPQFIPCAPTAIDQLNVHSVPAYVDHASSAVFRAAQITCATSVHEIGNMPAKGPIDLWLAAVRPTVSRGRKTFSVK